MTEIAFDDAGERNGLDAGQPDVDVDAAATPAADDVEPEVPADVLAAWGVPLEGDTVDVDEAPEVDVEVIVAGQRETLGLLLVVEDEPAPVRKARAAVAKTADDVAAQARELLADVPAQAQAQALAAAALEDEEQEAAAPPEPLFETLPQFVEQIIAVLYADELAVGGPRRWCGQWWRHPEVVFRLEALWRAFEHLRLDPTTGMSVFLRDHADPHMGVILSTDGPLRRCKPDNHHDPLARLTLVEPQDGLYTLRNA